jgi:hypothetical protein
LGAPPSSEAKKRPLLTEQFEKGLDGNEGPPADAGGTNSPLSPKDDGDDEVVVSQLATSSTRTTPNAPQLRATRRYTPEV